MAMDILHLFLRLTAERFDYLEANNRDFDFFDVYQIDLMVIDGAIISKAKNYELTRMELRDCRYFEIDNTVKDLVENLRNPFFHKWLEKRDTYFDSFKIILRNKKFGAGKYLHEVLVEVDDGCVKYC